MTAESSSAQIPSISPSSEAFLSCSSSSRASSRPARSSASPLDSFASPSIPSRASIAALLSSAAASAASSLSAISLASRLSISSAPDTSSSAPSHTSLSTVRSVAASSSLAARRRRSSPAAAFALGGPSTVGGRAWRRRVAGSMPDDAEKILPASRAMDSSCATDSPAGRSPVRSSGPASAVPGGPSSRDAVAGAAPRARKAVVRRLASLTGVGSASDAAPAPVRSGDPNRAADATAGVAAGRRSARRSASPPGSARRAEAGSVSERGGTSAAGARWTDGDDFLLLPAVLLPAEEDDVAAGVDMRLADTGEGDLARTPDAETAPPDEPRLLLAGPPRRESAGEPSPCLSFELGRDAAVVGGRAAGRESRLPPLPPAAAGGRPDPTPGLTATRPPPLVDPPPTAPPPPSFPGGGLPFFPGALPFEFRPLVVCCRRSPRFFAPGVSSPSSSSGDEFSRSPRGRNAPRLFLGGPSSDDVAMVLALFRSSCFSVDVVCCLAFSLRMVGLLF